MLGKIAIALLLAVQAGPKATEQDSGFDSDDIIVEGSRDQKRQINAFVEALTQARIDGQISRFEWTVCPAAVGLSPEKNEQVSARMKLVAAAAGIKVTDGGCRPNVLVIFTNNKRTMVEALYQRFPAYFSSMTPAEARKLAKLPGPAVAWQIEGMVDRDGVPLARDRVTDQYVLEATDTPSRIVPTSRPHFVGSVVVIEIEAASGLTTTQVADYAAMRAFVRTDPGRLGKSASPSILTVLEAPVGASIPVTLTEWDMGFLKALYASDNQRYATQQRQDIRPRLDDELRARGPGEAD